MVTISDFAQVINVNPYPDDDPWIAGDAVPLPVEEEALVPILHLTPVSLNTPLPSSVDNSIYECFPDIYDQEYGNECVQATEIYYSFTHEINRLRGVAAGNIDSIEPNTYHPFFTYNFENDGSGNTDYCRIQRK